MNARDDTQFIDDTEAVVRLGAMLLSSGTGSYRVKRAMYRAAAALRMDRADASVGVTEISVTLHRGDNFRTVVREVFRVRVDASRIEALENLSRRLPHPITGAQLEADLDEVSRTVLPQWRPWQDALAAGVACAGFAVLNRFPLPDAVGVLVAAACGQIVRRNLTRRWLNQFGTAALAAAAASLVYMALAWLAVRIGHGLLPVTGPGYVASLLFLVPGFPIITAILDIVKMDFIPGLVRSVYSIGLVFAATMSAWVISYATGLAPLPAATVLPGIWQWLAYLVATFVGVAGFAVLFNSSRRMLLVAACLGSVGNLCRLALVQASIPAQIAAALGGLVVGLVAAPIAPRMHLPRITLTVPACVIMIPGTAMYRMMYWLNGQDITKAISFGVDALLTVLAIGIGLAMARMLTDPAWAFSRPLPSPHAFRAESDRRGDDPPAPPGR